MYKRLTALSAFILVLVLGLSLNSALAQKPDQDEDPAIPERDGTYDVPGHPNLKVRVFVHNPKPSSSPATVCNLADPDSTAVVGAAGWHLPSGTWTYRLNLSSVPSSVGSAKLPTIAANVFNAWSATKVGTKLTFNRGSDTLLYRAAFDGQNIVAWGRTSGTALAVTYTWYYVSNNQVAEVDTIFNNKFAWSWTPYSTTACVNASTYDAQDILTHEVGHWMGLNDEYDAANYQNATMFGYGSPGEIKKDTLSSGDVAGVAAIYP